jgi:predicted nucleic acid-binding Zn ribbon protein
MKAISPGAALQALRPTLAKVCAHCGTGFTAKDPRAKFCSNRCRQAAKYQQVKARREANKLKP